MQNESVLSLSLKHTCACVCERVSNSAHSTPAIKISLAERIAARAYDLSRTEPLFMSCVCMYVLLNMQMYCIVNVSTYRCEDDLLCAA